MNIIQNRHQYLPLVVVVVVLVVVSVVAHSTPTMSYLPLVTPFDPQEEDTELSCGQSMI